MAAPTTTTSPERDDPLPPALECATTPFERHLRTLRDRGGPVYFEPLSGNNGDALIRMGMQHVLAKAGIEPCERPDDAAHILINGGGAMNDVWVAGVDRLRDYAHGWPDTPITVGPSTFRFEGIDFASVCAESRAGIHLFARDHISLGHLRDAGIPRNCVADLSHDLAFELRDSEFVADLRNATREDHVLVALRKDREGHAGVLAKTKGTWLPRRVRKPLSWIRDRLVAWRSRDVVGDAIRAQLGPTDLPTIYRDVSVSCTFDEFEAAIRDAALVLTDRLHVGILAHLLGKRVVIKPGVYHKARGVYELSMTEPGSRAVLL